MTRDHPPQKPAKAAPLSLSKRMSAESAFQLIAINCLQHVQANSAGVVSLHAQQQQQKQQIERLHQTKNDADDFFQIESVHQMRVGLRRLRTLLGLFKSVFTPPAELQQEIDWLGSELGAARDWDVLISATLPQVAAAAPDEAGLLQVTLAASCQAQWRHGAAAAAVDTARFVQLMSNCAAWLEERRWRDQMAPQQRKRLAAPITDLAASVLQQQQRQLHKRAHAWAAAESLAATSRQAKPKGDKPAASDSTVTAVTSTAVQAAAMRHRVRIAAKKTRYACEFFQSLFAGEHARQLTRQMAVLSKLQDQLGWLNDAATAIGLLAQLQHQQPALAADTSFIRGYLAACINRDARRAGRRWKKFPTQTLLC